MNGCDFPYSPKPQPDPYKGQTIPIDTAGSAVIGGHLYPVNPRQQTCNPSISQSPFFPGCMLWLGFDQLSVNAPDSLGAYSITRVKEHDRLTIVDTANTVRWYMMLGDFNAAGELQCPEWSTNPNYIVCLIGTLSKPYSGYAARVSDKKYLKICDKNLEQFSTPHLWVPDSAFAPPGAAVDSPEFDSNGFVVKDQVVRFFGTTRCKFVYTLYKNGGTLYYVDYSAGGDPAPIPLHKPAGRESWLCDSPLFSPDGNWIAFDCFENSAQGNYYGSYIQRLSPDSNPVLIADKASDPHWWVDRYAADQYYIVYTQTNGPYFTEYDFADPSIAGSGIAGSTVMRRLKGSWQDAPGFIGGLEIDDSYSPLTLVRLPFKGGLSPDGRFLCTAYEYAYLLRLN